MNNNSLSSLSKLAMSQLALLLSVSRRTVRACSGRAFVAIAAVAGVFVTQIGTAYSPWDWAYLGVTYQTQENALAAMHARSANHALLTEFRGIDELCSDPSWVCYKYGAPNAEGVIRSEWQYIATHDHSSPTEVEAARYAADAHDFVSNCGSPETQTFVGEFGVDGESSIGGVLFHQNRTRIFTWNKQQYDTETNWDRWVPTFCKPFTYSELSTRVRNVDCPSPYEIADGYWENGTPSENGKAYNLCVFRLTDTIAKRTLTDDACENTPNPIDVATGDKFRIEVDYEGPGLQFVRTYHSQELSNRRELGVGWTHNYMSHLAISWGEPIGLVLDNGKTVRLGRVQDVGYRSLSNTGYLVTGYGSGSGPDSGYLLESADGTKRYFDILGKLTRLVSEDGQASVVAYTNNRISSVTGPFGHQLTFHYDANTGQLQYLVDPSGQRITYQYTPVGNDRNLSRVIRQNGDSRQYVYENSNWPSHLTGILDENGARYLTVTYDSFGRAVTSELASGQEKVTVGYSANTTTVTEVGGGIWTYQYDDLNGNPEAPRKCAVKARNGAGATTWEYPNDLTTDPQRRPLRRTDPNGEVTAFAYAGFNVSKITEALGTTNERERTFAYADPANRYHPTLITEPSRTIGYTYNANGSVLTKTITDVSTSMSRTWTYGYTASGQLRTIDGPRTDVNDTTTYTYYNCTTGYQCGQVQTIMDALSHVTTFNTYNAHGQPLTITDANGVLTTLKYDLRQRLTSRTVGGEAAGFFYYPTGLLQQVAMPDGSFLNFIYDDAHRLTEINDAIGNRITYAYDAMSNRTAENVYDPSNALTNARSRVFNSLGQLWKGLTASASAAQTTEFGYDFNGNQTAINAPMSRNTTSAYDELNRLKQVTDPNNGITKYGYNSLDQLISVIDPRNLQTTYSYNGLGDLTQQLSPDTGATINTFDSGGNVQTSKDARNKTATYTYDALNRVTQVTYPDQTLTYTYDAGAYAVGKISSLTDSSGSTSWTYTPEGRVATKTQTIGARVFTVNYGYNAAGQLTTVTTPSNKTVTFGYTNNRITSMMVNSVNLLSNVLYEPFGATSGWTWGNGTLAVRTYDTDGKITQIDSAGFKTIGYDDAFRITTVTDQDNSANSWTYGYDTLDRLTSGIGSQTQSFTYDANGNRRTQGGTSSSTLTVSPTSNRLSSVSGALSRSYQYDNAGNTTSDGSATYTYNDAGRMTSVTKSGVTTTYTYNALGQRVTKTATGVTTYFVYDEAGQLLGEYDNTGSLIEEIAWMYDTPVASIRFGSCGLAVFYIHTDHLNTPRRITKRSTNQIVWRWDSNAFGTTMANENPSGLGMFVFNLRFPGMYADAETGLFYNYFRDYDPATGRYPKSDPIGLRGGINTYAYVRGNPISLIDRLGLAPGDVFLSDNDAGIDAIRFINPTSIKEGVEYAGMVYKNKDGTYSYTPPRKGDKESSSPGKCPVETERAGIYHTHADADPNYDNENFSPPDQWRLEDENIPGFLGTPAGLIKRYTPIIGSPFRGVVDTIGRGAK